ncbi:sialate O-acetylesterase [Thalassoglobus sp. JC818]|uniref:sialate O-acetylesterase n=1 Tax=Thalassoglobus sp. JC818 TaxID=3232136 RepID=UPI00345AFC3C
MKHCLNLIIAIVLLGVGVPEASAELRLAGIFADQMVLQRDQPIPVWGWAEAGDKVTVILLDQTKSAIANEHGAWSVTLKPSEADSHCRQLRVESGEQAIVVNDVLVGDVWHASGQSNMAMTVGAMAKELEPVAKDIAAAELPQLRFCRINEPESSKPLSDLRQRATWSVCGPKTVSHFSGVAFYFARRLETELNVPIGVIDTSRGGTPIEPFIPRAAFDSHPTLKKELELGDREDLEGIWKLPGGVRARDANWLPGRLFHSRLAPISRLGVRGAIWYQGESNSGVQEDPRDYQHKMRALINGWREAFGNEKLPVYFVQLPGSGAGEGWPYLREQQRLATDLPNTGMVVTLDLDGAGIHPPNKIDVGERLARWALAKDFGRSVPFSGPMFERQEIQGDRVILHFSYAESGLMVADKDGLAEPRETPQSELEYFEVTGSSGKWHPAKSTIDGKKVIVTSETITSPIAVRYAYAINPENCNLYNRDGLPASPFCSRPELLSYDPKLP